MAKLITKECAVEKDQIVAIINWTFGIQLKFKWNDGKDSVLLKYCPHYNIIVNWWNSSCEKDLILYDTTKCCNCCNYCNCCNKCCNNN